MLVLTDRVFIPVPPEDAFAWFQELETNYPVWHASHVACQHVRGGKLEPGTVLSAQEFLHGKLHKLKISITGLIPGEEITYRIGRGVRGCFRFQPVAGGVEFEASLFLGWKIPLLDGAGNLILKKLLGHRLTRLQQHMHEEGLNLKKILESYSVPETTTTGNEVSQPSLG